MHDARVRSSRQRFTSSRSVAPNGTRVPHGGRVGALSAEQRLALGGCEVGERQRRRRVALPGACARRSRQQPRDLAPEGRGERRLLQELMTERQCLVGPAGTLVSRRKERKALRLTGGGGPVEH